MSDVKGKLGADRRLFLKGAALAGAVPALAGARAAEAQVAAPRHAPAALPPTIKTIAAEVGEPASESNRIGGKPGSDFMIDVIKTLDIKYAPSNCASSFRALHESLINY